MGALMILNYDVNDRDGLTGYRAAASPILIGPQAGEVVAVSRETLNLAEGAPAGTDTVVLRFDSVERAKELFESEAYQAVVSERYRHTTPIAAFIVEELAPPAS